MKKKTTIALFVVMIIALTDSSFRVSDLQAKINAADDLLSENERLSEELESANKTVTAKVTGGFVATVRYTIPDYVLNDITDRIAILTRFQMEPFMLYLDEDIIAKLETGKTYYFEVDDTTVGEIPVAEFDKGYYYIEQGSYRLNIKSVREPKENEEGVNSPQLRYEEVEQNL